MPGVTLPSMEKLLLRLPRVYGTDKFSTVYLGEDRVYRVIRAAGEQMFEEMNQQSLLEKLPSYGVIETGGRGSHGGGQKPVRRFGASKDSLCDASRRVES